MTFRANGSTWTNVEEMHYYPFGMQMENAGTANPTNKYLYNGKERNEDFGLNWLDYGKRWYDAAVGRWWSVDSLAPHPNQIDKTPYQYGWNNPVRYDDPDGNCPWCFGAVVGALVEYGTQVATNYAQGRDDPFTANINVAAIGVAAVEGGLTSGASAGRKLAVKAGAAVVNNVVEVKTTESGSLETKVETNLSNIAKNAAIDLGTDGLVKTVAPTAKGTQKLLSKAGVNTGSVKKGIQNVAAATNTKVSSGTAKQTANQAVKGTSKAASTGAETYIKAKSNDTKETIKKKTDIGGGA